MILNLIPSLVFLLLFVECEMLIFKLMQSSMIEGRFLSNKSARVYVSGSFKHYDTGDGSDESMYSYSKSRIDDLHNICGYRGRWYAVNPMEVIKRMRCKRKMIARLNMIFKSNMVVIIHYEDRYRNLDSALEYLFIRIMGKIYFKC